MQKTLKIPKINFREEVSFCLKVIAIDFDSTFVMKIERLFCLKAIMRSQF